MTDNRLLGADFLRAFACLVVFGHHLAQRMSWNEPVGWMEWLRVFNLTNFSVALGLQAGAMGVPFLPTRSAQ